jgi:chromosomal replication initiation ATPase DnaA
VQIVNERVSLQRFLKSLQEALSVQSLNSLINTLEETVGNRKYDKDEIDLIIQIVCLHYNVSSKALKNTKQKGIVLEARHQCYCLMHFELKLPLRYISNKVFKNSHQTVYNGIKRFRGLNTKLKLDKEFIDNHIAIKEKYISEKSKPHTTIN